MATTDNISVHPGAYVRKSVIPDGMSVKEASVLVRIQVQRQTEITLRGLHRLIPPSEQTALSSL